MFAATVCTCLAAFAPPWGEASAAVAKIRHADQAHQDKLMLEHVVRAQLAVTDAQVTALVAWGMAHAKEYDAPQAGPAEVRAVLDLVAAHAADPRAVRPLMFVATYRGTAPADRDQAASLLQHYHLTNPEFVRTVGYDQLTRLDWYAPMLRDQIAADGLSVDQRARLRFALAKYLKRCGRTPAERAESLTLFEKLVADDVKLGPIEGYTLPDSIRIRDVARGYVFGLTHVGVGKPAPALAGTATDGDPLSLTDYRGQVVLVSFWCTNCGSCMVIVPEEKRLAAKYAGRPFAILGVNGDDTPALALKTAAKTGLAWRSLWRNKARMFSHPEETWNIGGWPTLYVVDHTGTIRATPHHTDKLDATLDRLVADAEAAARPAR